MMGGRDMFLLKDFYLPKQGKIAFIADKFVIASSHYTTIEDAWCGGLKKKSQ